MIIEMHAVKHNHFLYLQVLRTGR